MDKEYTIEKIEDIFNNMDSMHDCYVGEIKLNKNVLTIIYDNLNEGILKPDGTSLYKYSKLIINYYLEKELPETQYSWVEVIESKRRTSKVKIKTLTINEFIDYIDKKGYELRSYYFSIDTRKIFQLNFDVVNKLGVMDVSIYLSLNKITYEWIH